MEEFPHEGGVHRSQTLQPRKMPGELPIGRWAGQLSFAGDVLHGVVFQCEHGQVVLDQESCPLTNSHSGDVQGRFFLHPSDYGKEVWGIVWGEP